MAEEKTQKSIKTMKSKVANPLWLSVSEAAKIGGVTQKTIRRAIQSKNLAYRINKNRYQLNLKSVINFLHTNKKLANKLKIKGIGQYIKDWIE